LEALPATRAVLSALVALAAALSCATPREAIAQPAASERRLHQLGRVVDRNVGHAHMTRGVNVCTTLALRDAVTDADIPVLARMLESKDSVHRLAAAYVLSVMGDSAVETLRARGERIGKFEIEDLVAHAPATLDSLRAYRTSGSCKRKL